MGRGHQKTGVRWGYARICGVIDRVLCLIPSLVLSALLLLLLAFLGDSFSLKRAIFLPFYLMNFY